LKDIVPKAGNPYGWNRNEFGRYQATDNSLTIRQRLTTKKKSIIAVNFSPSEKQKIAILAKSLSLSHSELCGSIILGYIDDILLQVNDQLAAIKNPPKFPSK
jgi:hypothetical protein